MIAAVMEIENANVQELVDALQTEQGQALNSLMEACYDDLKRLARQRLKGERDVTLSTTSLVHDLYMKLCTRERLSPASYAHFLSLCGQAMRQVLIDHLRRTRAVKRGGNTLVDDSVDPDDAEYRGHAADEGLMMVEALERLEAIDSRLSKVLECRFFAGMTEEETARALDIPLRTVQRDWARARAWLAELSQDAD